MNILKVDNVMGRKFWSHPGLYGEVSQGKKKDDGDKNNVPVFV